jgi:hypothetical protein
MEDFLPVIIVLIVFVGFIVLIVYLGKAGKRKAEEKAAQALQMGLLPGEQLIEFTRANTKGPSSATVMLTGAIGAAISRSGGVELYVGLTNRYLRLTPVNQNDSAQGAQIIPLAEISNINFESGMYANSTMKVHSQKGEMSLYISSGASWIRKAVALQKAFLSLLAQGAVARGDADGQPSSWTPLQQTQLVSFEDKKSALEKSAKSGRNSMIAGGIFFVLGIFLTAISEGQVLFWGAIVFGLIAFFVGLAKFIKAKKDQSDL